jgi:hypothetical protein
MNNFEKTDECFKQAQKNLEEASKKFSEARKIGKQIQWGLLVFVFIQVFLLVENIKGNQP